MDNIFVISLFCVGIHTLTRDNCILSFWQKIVLDEERELRTELFEPLTECLVCMSSLWSCVFLCYFQGVDSMTATFFIMAYLAVLAFDIAIGGSSLNKILYFCIIAIVIFYLSNPIQSIIMMISVAGLNFTFLSISVIASNTQEY